MDAIDFPIQPLLPRITAALAEHPRLVLEAPPGAGKTTQVPLALLDAPWLQGRRLIVLEPRRVAARAAAEFMAQQLGEPIGRTVGYRIRFDSQASAQTRILVVSEGVLIRMLQDDPACEDVGGLLFDEFHERHLAADLGLALAREIQAALRPDLRLVLMSATLDGERLAALLDAPRLTSAGRGFPVASAHFPIRRGESPPAQMARAVEHALAAHPGDVLAFLPGQREIAQVRSILSARLADAIELLVLHGELPVAQQAHALRPAAEARRRVVLATNLAESSVTLPGVRVVIDSGLAREPRFDPGSGLTRLQVTAIAQASADQRAGRAGRVAAGWAYRLWPQSQRLEAQRRPEIAQAELSALALELAAWGSDALPFVDPPPAGALAAGRDLLRCLAALDTHGRITTLGRRMLALGTHPRLAAMLLAAADDPARALACDLAALLEARDPLRGDGDGIAPRWRALAAYRAGRPLADARAALAAIDAASRQWRRRLRLRSGGPTDAPAHRLGALLAHAFPDRIGHRRDADPRRYQLANGRLARLEGGDSDVYGEPWIVVSELRPGRDGDARILRAAPLDEGDLRACWPNRFFERERVRWDPDRRALSARRERCFDAIVLDARPGGRVDPEQAAQALTDAVAELGLAALPWSDALRQWRARLRCLRQWMPELSLPDLSDAALLATRAHWLRPAFTGKTRLDELDADTLADALRHRIDWRLRQRLEMLAPERIGIPSGMHRRIDYGYDDAADVALAPVLAVKLQELFGLAETPRIADGRVALTLHLLSPAGRPLQVTQDLRGFWRRTYPEIRKEMLGRYPRHPWPEDPWNAAATHRAKPRRR